MTTAPRIVVTRSLRDAPGLAALLRALPAVVETVPAIRIQPVPEATTEARRGLRSQSYDWILFTSANSVEAVWPTHGEVELAPSTLVGAVGPATRAALARRGVDVSFVPRPFTTDALASQLPDPSHKRILLLRAEVSNPRLPRVLTDRGAAVVDIPVYRTVPDESLSKHVEPWRRAPPEWIVVASPSAIQSIDAVLPPDHPMRTRTRIAAIGPVTAQAAHRLGFEVAAQATDHTAEGLAAALREALDAR